ncbi:hypothetical protein evm_009206 [Chilo suppressalis]|nr:hypothetical protein evm_009206 [Chilo suppressalis]
MLVPVNREKTSSSNGYDKKYLYNPPIRTGSALRAIAQSLYAILKLSYSLGTPHWAQCGMSLVRTEKELCANKKIKDADHGDRKRYHRHRSGTDNVHPRRAGWSRLWTIKHYVLGFRDRYVGSQRPDSELSIKASIVANRLVVSVQAFKIQASRPSRNKIIMSCPRTDPCGTPQTISLAAKDPSAFVYSITLPDEIRRETVESQGYPDYLVGKLLVLIGAICYLGPLDVYCPGDKGDPKTDNDDEDGSEHSSIVGSAVFWRIFIHTPEELVRPFAT